MTIIVVSCNHFPDDERIYHRQIKTLLDFGATINYFTRSSIKINLNEDRLRHFNFSNNLSVKKYITKILKILEKQKVSQFLHIHEPELLPLAKQIKHRLKIKVIYDVHEDLDAMYRTFSQRTKLVKETSILLKHITERRHLSFVDNVILANRPLRRTLYEHKGFRPVILENFPQKKYVIKIPKNTKHNHSIIYHGHLGPERGIHDLVMAMPQVISKNPYSKLTLIGTFRTKEFEQKIRKSISEYELKEKVQIKSQLPYLEIWDELYHSALGVIPFQNNIMSQNNTPTKLFEMMAAGCRIVTSDLPPIRNFLSNTVHWTIPNDISSLASGIIDAQSSLKQTDWIDSNIELINKKYNWELKSVDFLNVYNL